MAIFNFTNFSGMLNVGVWDFQKPANELSAMKNVQEDRVGILKRVPGYAKAVNDQVNWAATNVNFLHYYFRPSTGIQYLLAGSNKWTGYTIEHRTTWNWTAMNSGGTYASRADAKLSAVNYLDKAFIVGYDPVDKEYLSPATVKGTDHITSAWTDSDLTNMPSGRFLVRYRDLLYVLYAKVGSDIYPSRAYYCDDPVDMKIPDWTVLTNFVEFGQDDGDEITWGADAYDKLVVFKTNSMWTYDEEDRRKVADIGCDSSESIRNINGVLYWANRYGIWRWAGDLPQLISGKVQPFMDSINQGTLWQMVASNVGFEYRLFIGDVTVDWVSYTNTWICFDVRREKLYIRCTIHKPLSFSKYIEAGKERIYFGANTGYVYKMATYQDNVNSDDGDEIDYFFTTNNLDFWAAQTVKNWPDIYFFTHNAGWMKYVVDVDHKGEFNAREGYIGESNMKEEPLNVNCNRLAIKFYGKDKDKPFEFEGFVIEINGLENVNDKN